ncbi:MAG TPA: VWA domain-containing protein, partial [Candidatus Binatus sp.]|nr:VWA domain-containing protein [Candidatus Binatus sp.]
MSFGVLNPAGALAFTALAVLIALYLRGRRRRVVPVATLFLWQRVPAQALDPERFRPDLLFLAQLALLLALIGGYLRPYLEDVMPAGEGVRLLIVLDASASMQAREDVGTRFDVARGRARALVAQLLTGDEVMLVAAADRTHVVLRWTADHARALDRLEALEPLDTPTDLAPALELALGEVQARPATRVVVLTDLPREASGVGLERLGAVDYVQIGRTDDNVAIAGLELDEPPFHPASDATVTVVVRSYGRAARRVVLEATVGGAPWTRRELGLAPRGTEQVLLTHPPGAGELTVALVADDALPVDDRAVGWLADREPLDVLVVTGSPA